jgi:hypothetical protein
MKVEDATTPLRQHYCIIPMMLMNPNDSASAREMCEKSIRLTIDAVQVTNIVGKTVTSADGWTGEIIVSVTMTAGGGALPLHRNLYCTHNWRVLYREPNPSVNRTSLFGRNIFAVQSQPMKTKMKRILLAMLLLTPISAHACDDFREKMQVALIEAISGKNLKCQGAVYDTRLLNHVYFNFF